ncbi:hypothetical protein [Microbacterium sp. P5_E9]
MTTTEAPRRIVAIGSLLWRAVLMELRVYANIGRAIVRRPALPVGASGFGYHRPVLTILLVFIGLSAIEIPIIDLIAQRWPAARVGLLILGIWGVTWMVGLLCAYLMRPHTVGPDGIRARQGLEIDIPLAWDDVASVARKLVIDAPKAPRIADTEGVRILSLRMQNETNVEILLERPTEVRLPGHAPKGGAQVVEAVRLWTDDLDGFMAAVREHMP